MRGRYIILNEEYRVGLVRVVNKAIEKGYTPTGGVTTVGENNYYMQAMFKETPDAKD